MSAASASGNLDGFTQLDRAACLDLWQTVHGRLPPKHLSVRFLRRALSYETQCAANGGVSNPLDRALRKLASGKTGSSRTCHSLRPGHHLLREWNGRTYQVEVLDKGFKMDGRTYRSLSGIAKLITGAEWSGPRFFGLT